MVSPLKAPPPEPGLDPVAMAIAKAIGGKALPVSLSGDDINVTTGMPVEMSKLMMSDMDIADLSGDGWIGNAYSMMAEAEGATPASTDTVVVYNNKGANVDVIYTGHYKNEMGAGDTGDLELANVTGVLGFANNTLGKFSEIIMLPSLEAETLFDNIEANDDEADGEPTTIDGTFNGLEGSFACIDAAGCRLIPVAGGGYAAVGGWTFTPKDADMATELAKLKVSIHDPDYMHLGYWLTMSTAKGEPTAMAFAFSGGTMPSVMPADDNGVRGLMGSAEYAGSASGLYVRKELTPDGNPEHLYHGQFTANAALTARFGGEEYGDDSNYEIEGSVTNFMDGGNAIDASWSVTLKDAPFDTDNIFSGVTEGDKGMMGSWNGRFFGMVMLDDPDGTPTPDEDETVYPSGVGGSFNGHFLNGHVLGGYGADQVEE